LATTHSHGDERARCGTQRMLKKPVQQGRSERKVEAYSFVYVEALSEARTPLEGFCNILRWL